MDTPTRRLASAIASATLLVATSCIPYSVASTADPTPPGQTEPTAIWFAIPNGASALGDTTDRPIFGADAEVRFGLDDRSDAGVRLTSASGIVATYKRRLDAPSGTDRAAFAAQAGLGFVNMGSHAHFELTLLASARQRMLTPYGGLRAMQVAPLNKSAVHDEPSLGGFFGVRIGERNMAFSPEVAVYYDRSALGLRKNNIIVVPAIAAHGEELIRLIGTVIQAVR
jgi:hypothetical protein